MRQARKSKPKEIEVLGLEEWNSTHKGSDETKETSSSGKASRPWSPSQLQPHTPGECGEQAQHPHIVRGFLPSSQVSRDARGDPGVLVPDELQSSIPPVLPSGLPPTAAFSAAPDHSRPVFHFCGSVTSRTMHRWAHDACHLLGLAPSGSAQALGNPGCAQGTAPPSTEACSLVWTQCNGADHPPAAGQLGAPWCLMELPGISMYRF